MLKDDQKFAVVQVPVIGQAQADMIATFLLRRAATNHDWQSVLLELFPSMHHVMEFNCAC